MSELAIKIQGLKKQYRLGQIGGGTLSADLQSWWARVRHKEDPNSKIGADQRLIGQTFMALNGIDLEVKQGEALGIIGGNGAGKSTMLKILSRITAPTEGSVDIYGRIASMLEVGTGFSGEMTGRENVYMNGAILGMTKEEIDAKMEDIIEFSEVREFIDTPVKRYSSGMYVKLAFSVAAHLDSEIMIMDEVLAVGDMAFQKKCLDKMRSAATVEGKTVLYVSHNMNTIRQLCDRCVVLDKGRIIFQGDVEEAIEVYLGNAVHGTQHNDFTQREKDPYITADVQINTLDLLTENTIPYGQSLRFVLQVEARKNIASLHFRTTILQPDRIAVATATSEKVSVSNEKKNYLFELELETSQLAPGSYIMQIVAFEPDGLGQQIRHDYVPLALAFDVVSELNQLHNFEWNTRAWGTQALPDAKVLEL